MAQPMVLYAWKAKHFQYLGERSAEGDDVHESRFILLLIMWQWTTRTKGLEGKRKKEYLNGTAKIKSDVNHMFQEIHILCFSILSYVSLWHYVYDISVTRPTQKRYPLETRHMIISSFSFPLRAKLEFFIIFFTKLNQIYYIHLLFYILERSCKSRTQIITVWS